MIKKIDAEVCDICGDMIRFCIDGVWKGSYCRTCCVCGRRICYSSKCGDALFDCETQICSHCLDIPEIKSVFDEFSSMYRKGKQAQIDVVKKYAEKNKVKK